MKEEGRQMIDATATLSYEADSNASLDEVLSELGGFAYLMNVVLGNLPFLNICEPLFSTSCLLFQTHIVLMLTAGRLSDSNRIIVRDAMQR